MSIVDRLERIEARLSRLEGLAGVGPFRGQAAAVTPDYVDPFSTAGVAARTDAHFETTARDLDAATAATPLNERPAAVPREVSSPQPFAPPLPPQPPHPSPVPVRRATPARETAPHAIAKTTAASRLERDSNATIARGTKSTTDFERFVGVSILGRVGVAALLLAAGYFAQWTYQRIGAVEKVTSIYLLAALLVGAGAWLYHRVSRVYLGILWGGGVAAAYMAGFVARVSYDLVGPFAATAMLAGACVLGQALARRAQMQTLALVSILGAAAAPVLVGSTVDARTSLLVYLLAIHGWSAWTERRWGWTGARLVGLASTGIVASLWLATNGRPDVSTFVHVHAYLLGWTAPEWGTALAGRTPGKERSIVLVTLLAVAEACALVLAFSSGDETLRRGFAVVAAAVWGAIAIGARLRTGEAGALVRGLARIGGALLVLGAITVFHAHGLSASVTSRDALLAVTVAGLLVFVGRSLLRVGEGPATLASVVGLILASNLASASPNPWAAVSLVVPLVLLVRGDLGAWRITGVCLAAAAPFLALSRAWQADAWWLVAAFATSTALVATAQLRAARKDDRALAAAAALLSVGLAVAWAACAVDGPLLPLPLSITNPGTATAALVLAGLAIAWRSTAGAAARFESVRALVGGVFLAVLLGAIWREVHDVANRMVPRDLGTVLESATLVAYASALAVIGRRKAGFGLAMAGSIVFAIASLFVVGTASRSGGPWTAAAQIALLAVPATLAAMRRDASDGAVVQRVLACAVLGAAVLAWIVAWDAGRFDGATTVANARCLVGALLVVALVLVRRSMPRAAWPTLAPMLAVGASALSLVVGLAEVLNAVGGVEQGPWRRVLVSVYATLHCAAILAIGFRVKDALLRWLAIGGFAAVVVKVGLFDLSSGVPTELRVLVTACLGAVLLGTAFAYAKRTKALAQAPDTGPDSVETQDDPEGGS